MRWIEAENIDKVKWEKWCHQSVDNQPFLSLDYLQSVSRKLAFVLNDQETGGMPLPYFEKWGVKTLYTPVFSRWIDWIGADAPDTLELTVFLQNHFQQADFYCRREILNLKANTLIYQGLQEKSFKLNQQAKRKVKSIQKEEIDFVQKLELVQGLQLIKTELKGRIATLAKPDFDTLEVLLNKHLKNNTLIQVNLVVKDQMEGVLFLIQTESRLLYLKGTCSKKWKSKGGMYALMQFAIELAFSKQLDFDFGGSRVEGVRRFNLCFGGKDINYYQYLWDKGPLWYKLLKTARNKWRKK